MYMNLNKMYSNFNRLATLAFSILALLAATVSMPADSSFFAEILESTDAPDPRLGRRAMFLLERVPVLSQQVCACCQVHANALSDS